MNESKKKMGLLASTLFGLALLLPMAPASVYGVIQPLTHGHMALAYIFAAIPMTFIAFSFGQLGAEFPRAGSSYTFVSESIHPYGGFIVGWTLLIDYGLFPIFNLIALATYICEIIPGLSFKMVIIFCIIIICFINLIGIKAVVTINNILTLFVLLVVSYFIDSCVSIFNDPNNNIAFSTIGFINPGTFSWPMLLNGVSIACFSFLGFDAITTLPEDVNNPKQVIPSALLLTCVIMCVVFVAVSWFAQCVYPSFNYTNPNAALLDAALIAGGKDLFYAISLAMIVGSFAFSLDMMASITRLMFGMGRDGVLPKKFFGYTNNSDTPVYNIILVTIFYLILCGMSIKDLMPIINFGALFVFICVNLSVIVYFYIKKKMRTGFKNILKYLIIPGTGFITSVALWFSLPINAKMIGGIWLIFGVIYLAIWSKGFKKKIYFGGDPDFALKQLTEEERE